jgi:HPt (histidine-containing phosphotransfer) domain-containing protein
MNHPFDVGDRHRVEDRHKPAAPAATTTGPTASPPVVPAPPVFDIKHVFDTEHLARMTLGDENLEREVLEMFIRQADMLLGRMENQPASVVAGLSHTLIGSARGVGAWKVAVAAEALERNDITPAVTVAIGIRRLAEAVTEARSAIADRYRAVPEKSGSDIRFT